MRGIEREQRGDDVAGEDVPVDIGAQGEEDREAECRTAPGAQQAQTDRRKEPQRQQRVGERCASRLVGRCPVAGGEQGLVADDRATGGKQQAQDHLQRTAPEALPRSQGQQAHGQQHHPGGLQQHSDSEGKAGAGNHHEWFGGQVVVVQVVFHGQVAGAEARRKGDPAGMGR